MTGALVAACRAIEASRSACHSAALDDHDRCGYTLHPSLGGASIVMMQSTEDRSGEDLAGRALALGGCTHGAGDLLLEPLVRSRDVEVGSDIFAQ